ncbi:MAG: FadR family transcriptional regulator [Clostridiaceae bacterium]|nr:FadR family transcriptional regulator [Clostridiaceae bacterium]
MASDYQTLKADSLKDLFVKEIEAKIISGSLKPGDRLPPERDLASMMGISRGIVNSGILELASKGFVKIRPRKGTFVIDYNSEGTPHILSSIMNYNQGKLDIPLFLSMMDTRLLLEGECARLAAVNRTNEDLMELDRILNEYADESTNEPQQIASLNYQFHHRITIASGNIIYAMIFKSFEPVCKNLIQMYFESEHIRSESIKQHRQLYKYIHDKNPEEAAGVMNEILMQGKNELLRLNAP